MRLTVVPRSGQAFMLRNRKVFSEHTRSFGMRRHGAETLLVYSASKALDMHAVAVKVVQTLVVPWESAEPQVQISSLPLWICSPQWPLNTPRPSLLVAIRPC